MKPGNFILDLLRTYGHKGTSARNIMASSGMFEFSENLIRVTLSRLVSRGLVENFERGQYRLASLSDPMAEFIEEWRLGESRRRAWHPRTWIIAHRDVEEARSTWVLQATGFRELRAGLWVRPDNLIRTGEQLVTWLRKLGLDDSTLLGECLSLSIHDHQQAIDLYETDSAASRYISLTNQLQKSSKQLAKMPIEQAMRESFTLGGEALQVLAKDPYLPDEIQDKSHRVTLWKSMLAYDELGRTIWSGVPGNMPASITSYA